MSEEKKKHPGGRPVIKLDLECVRKLAASGMTEEQVAIALDISRDTLKRNKDKYKEFCNTIRKAKTNSDGVVIRSLWERAIGYSHEEDKIFCHNGKIVVAKTIKHYPPDSVAAIFWLKNRQPLDWKDRVEHTGADGQPLTIQVVNYANGAAAV